MFEYSCENNIDEDLKNKTEELENKKLIVEIDKKQETTNLLITENTEMFEYSKLSRKLTKEISKNDKKKTVFTLPLLKLFIKIFIFYNLIWIKLPQF